MSVPKGRSKDIETKARHSSFKTKLRNDHENHLLSLQLHQLHSKTVASLEDHWKSTMEVVTIFKGCNKTSGTSPLGIRPTRSDMHGCLQNLHSKTTPWEHFGKFTIDSWQRHEDGDDARPKTAHTASQNTKMRNARPKTAPVYKKRGEVDATDEQEGGDDERTATLPMSELSAQDRNRKMLQLQAKAATMTRSKFLDLESTGPMYNRNLASVYRENPGSAKRPNKLEVTLPKEEDVYLDHFPDHHSHIQPGCGKSWDLHRLRDEFQKRRDETPSQDRRNQRAKTAPSSGSKGTAGKTLGNDSKSQHKKKAETKAKTPAVDHQSIASISRGDSRRTMFSDDDNDQSPIPRSRVQSRHSNSRPDPPSETEIKETAEYVDMMTRISRHPVLNTRRFKSPKFYVRPQERYKMDQHFLMKRYFFLQRQMNKNHEDEAALLAKAGTALVVNTTFTRSARLKFLTALIDENDAQQQNQRRFGNDELMRRKVDNYLRSVAEFVQYSAPEESLVIMVPRPREELPVRKKLLR